MNIETMTHISHSVEELKTSLLRQKTTKPAFKWPFNLDETKRLMLAAYQAEVEHRRRRFSFDNATKKNITNVCLSLCNTSHKCGMFLCGRCGNGKTTMLYALQNLLNYLSDNSALPEQTGICIIDAIELANTAKNIQAYRRLKQLPNLGIEDMGREPREVLDYGNIYNPVIDLLEYRYVEQSYTVITTNLTPDNIRKHYGERIADRLREMVDIIVFENDTYRNG